MSNVPQDVISKAAYEGAREYLAIWKRSNAEPVANDDKRMLIRHALGCLLEALESSDKATRLTNMDAPKIVRDAIDFLKTNTATPDYAAGMMRAAEIAKSDKNTWANPEYQTAGYTSAKHEIATDILSAIPADSKTALREYVREKCSEAVLEARRRWKIDNDVPLRVIVNSVLEGKS